MKAKIQHSALAAVMLLLVAVYSFAGVTGPASHFTAGKAKTDSLAAAPDTFTAQVLPASSGFDSLAVWAANDSTVLYTVQIEVGTGEWYTLDTTSVVKGAVSKVTAIPATYSGLNWRLIADNQTSTTSYARVYLAGYRTTN